ncbi:MAG: hypothetical protein ABI167_05375 [Nitrosospira sp.]
MANKQTTARLNRNNGDVTFQQHEADAPIIPVAQLERLQKFSPETVTWVIEQTQREAEHRRSQDVFINQSIYKERRLGQIFSLITGVVGILGGAYTATMGYPWTGGVIATAAITSLAVVFLTKK